MLKVVVMAIGFLIGADELGEEIGARVGGLGRKGLGV
jgi:small-conductance mechanosensitive channel